MCIRNNLLKALLPILFFSLAGQGFSQTLISNPAATNNQTNYCQGTDGVEFGVDNAVISTNYILEKSPNGSSGWANVANITATVSPAVFPGKFTGGYYRLAPSSTWNIQVIEIALPENEFNVTGGGSYCSGSTNYPSIGLSGSQPTASNIVYKLFRGATEVATLAGTGAALNFGPQQQPGVYTVKAFRGICPKDMIGSKSVTINNLPTASFTHIEGSAPGGCGNVTFNATVNGVLNPTSGYSYSWKFGAVLSTQNIPNPTHRFPAYGVGTQIFQVELTVTDANGCQTFFSNNVTVTRRPHAQLAPESEWFFCSSEQNAQFLLKISNTSTTAASNTGYLIEWGDGLPNLSLTPAQFPFGGQVEHTYSQKGSFPLKITVFGATCNNDTTYSVFNGSNPAGGIVYTAASLIGCTPWTITFKLDGAAYDNTPTTSYTFDFGDGSPIFAFTQENMPDSLPDGYCPIIHTYTNSSCNEPGKAFKLLSLVLNPCGDVPNDVGGIKISKKAIPDFLRNEFPNDPIFVCATVAKTFTNNTVPGCVISGSNSVTSTNYYWEIDGNQVSTATNPSLTFPTPGTYYVKLRAFTGESYGTNCGDSSIIRQVCVQAAPQPSFNLPGNAFCTGQLIIPTNTSVISPGCAVPHYTWIINPSTGVTFEEGTNANSTIPKIKFTQAVNYTISLRMRYYSGATHCSEVITPNQQIIIRSTPAVTINTNSLQRCGPGDVPIPAGAVTYSNGNGTLSYIWTVNPPGPTFSNPNTAHPTITISQNLTQTYVLTVKVTNECGEVTSQPINVIVTQTIGDNTLLPYQGNTTLCSNMTLTHPIQGSTPSGGNNTYTYKWYIKQGTGNWAQIPGQTGKDLNYTTALTTNPTLFKREVNSGSCSSDSGELTFIITPGISNNTIAQNQSICSGNIPAQVSGSTPTGGGGSYTYTWQKNIPPATNWTDIPSSNIINYTPPSLSQTTNYRRLVEGGGCSHTSTSVTVSVYGIIDNNTIQSNTTEVCSGNSPGQITGSDPQQQNNNQFSYQWQSGSDGVNFSNITSATSKNYTPGAINLNTWYRRIVTSTPASVPNGCRTDTSEAIMITVNPNPISQPTASATSIPNGGTTALQGSASGGTQPYVTWFWSLPGGGTAPVSNPNAQNPTTNPLTSTTTFNLTVTDSKGCSDTKSITITVTGGALQTSVSANPAHICIGGSTTLTANATGGNPANYAYSWSSSPAGSYPNTASIVVSPTVNTTYTVAVSDGFYNQSANTTVTVYGPVTNNTIATNVSELCSGNSPGLITGSDPSQQSNNQFSYQWQSSSDGVNFTNIASATGKNYTPLSLTQNTWFRRIVTSTPASVPNDCKTDYSQSVQIIVNENPVADAGPNRSIYYGGTVTISGAASCSSGNCSYLWTPQDKIASGQGTLSPTTVNMTPPPNPHKFYLKVTDSETGCFRTDSMEITVSGNVLLCQIIANNSSVCIGESVTLTVNGSGGSGSYQDYTWTLPDGTNLSGQTINHTPSVVGGNVYSVQLSDGSNTTSCNTTIQVVQRPSITSNTEKMICSDDQVSYLPSANLPVSNYAWTTVSNPNVIGNTSGSGLNINDVLRNPTSDVIEEVIYTLRAFGTGSTNCEGPPFNLTVKVNPVAKVNTSNGLNSQTVVSGQSAQSVQFVSNVAGVNYVWTSTTNCPGQISYPALSGTTPNIPAQVITITGTQQICIITYTVKAYLNNCPGSEYTYQIIVNLAPTIFNVGGGGEFCSGSSTEVTLSGSETGIKYFLLLNGSPVADIPHKDGTGLPLTWTSITIPGIYTVRALNPSNNTPEMMDGEAVVVERALPFQFVLTAQGPFNGCVPVTPMLYNSQAGAEYSLYLNDDPVPKQIIYNNTAGTLIFETQNQPGIYKVKSRINYDLIYCERLMYDSIIANPLPQEFELLPKGHFCNLDSVKLCIAKSETGINYRLWRNNQAFGSVLPGTGDTICFGRITLPGFYTIHAVNPSTSCFIFFKDTLFVNPAPQLYSIMPAKICPGGLIYLNGCQEDVKYYLYLNPAKREMTKDDIVDSVTCDQHGQPVYFKPQYVQGNYKVKAVNMVSECERWMEGTTTVLPLPVAYNITPSSGKFCTYHNLHIGLDETQPGYTYQLHRMNAPDNPQGELTGDGSGISFGLVTKPGTYKVKAISSDSCQQWMLGEIILSNPPAKFNMLANGNLSQAGWFCSPVEISLPASQSGVKYLLYWDNADDPIKEITGTGLPLVFGIYSLPGTYTIIANDPNTTCSSEMNNFIGIYEGPEIYTLTSIQNPSYFCAGNLSGVDLMLSQSQSGVIYQLFKGIAGVGNPVTGDESGGPIIWNNASQFGAGYYRVVAKFPDDPACEATMDKIIHLREIARPLAGFNEMQNHCLYDSCINLALNLTAELPVKIKYSDGQQVFEEVFDHTITNPFIKVCPTTTTTYNIVSVEYTQLVDCNGFITGTDVDVFQIPEVSYSYYQENNCSAWLQFEDRSTASMTSISERIWTFKAGYHSTLKYPRHDFGTVGKHPVKLRVKDQRGCWNEKTDTVQISEFFDFGILNTNVCFGDTILFGIDPNTLLPTGNIIRNYYWTFGDGSSPQYTRNPKHLYSMFGNFEVSLTAEDHTNCVKTNKKSVFIPTPLSPDFSFIDCKTVCEFFCETQGSIVQWKWHFGDGDSAIVNAPEIPIVTHIYTKSGTYPVALTVIDGHGCSQTSIVKTVRTDCYDIVGFYVPTAFAPYHLNEEVKIFQPKGINIEEYHIEVFDLWGNLLWESTVLDEEGSPVESWDGNLNNTPVQQGSYVWRAFVKFRDGNIWYLDKEKGTRTGTVTLIR